MAALVDAGLKAEGASSSSLHFETLTSLTGFGLTAISSNGLWWAVATAGRVVIRAVSAPEQVAQMLQCVDKIDKIEFSPDGEYLMCALYARQAIQIFSMADPTWKCRINESAAGLISAVWAPDSRTVLTESDFGIQLSLWSLTDSSQAVISLPKPAQRQFKCQFTSFSDCNRFLAVVHRIDLQDMIGIYSLHPATEMVKFKARSGDVNVINWLPGGTHLITIDSPLTYKCCVYTPSGEVVFAYEAYQNALGIRTVTFTPAAGEIATQHIIVFDHFNHYHADIIRSVFIEWELVGGGVLRLQDSIDHALFVAIGVHFDIMSHQGNGAQHGDTASHYYCGDLGG